MIIYVLFIKSCFYATFTELSSCDRPAQGLHSLKKWPPGSFAHPDLETFQYGTLSLLKETNE